MYHPFIGHVKKKTNDERREANVLDKIIKKKNYLYT